MGMMGGPPSMHWWGRRNKQPDTGQANSGLTGDPALEQPPLPEGPKDLRGRWENLKQSVTGTTAALPQVLRLVWEASPRTTISLFATTAISGLIPTISVGITLMLTNAVTRGIQINVFHLADKVSLSSLGVPWMPNLQFTAVGMIVFLAVVQLVVF